MRSSRKTWFAVVFVAGILIYEGGVAWYEAKEPHFFGDLYVALSGFAGSYAPMPGQPESPSPWMAVGLDLALLTTFGAALTLLAALFRRELTRMRLLRAHSEVVIVGSSQEADLIARSCANDVNVARIFEPGRREEPRVLVLEAGQPLRENKAATSLLGAASTIIVAASSDTTSARFATEAREAAPTVTPFTLLRSDQMMSAMRPAVLRTFPPNEVFHPDDNVAQIVSECVARQANAGNELRVLLRRNGGSDSSTLEEWCRNAQSAGQQIFGSKPWTFTDSISDCDLIVVSGNEEWVATQVATMTCPQPVIAVVSCDLLSVLPLGADRIIMSWPEWVSAGTPLSRGDVLVVDPQREGLNLQVISDGLSSQWGRAFNDAYGFLYARSDTSLSEPTGAWDAKNRNGQSSIAAAKFMLKNLRNYGYELQRGDAGWHPSTPSNQIIEQMARAEHQDWRADRKWESPQYGEIPAPNEVDADGNIVANTHDVPFDDLDAKTRQYNVNVILRVYPALAAMFGYGIRPSRPGNNDA